MNKSALKVKLEGCLFLFVGLYALLVEAFCVYSFLNPSPEAMAMSLPDKVFMIFILLLEFIVCVAVIWIGLAGLFSKGGGK